MTKELLDELIDLLRRLAKEYLRRVIFFEIEGDQDNVRQAIMPDIEIRGIRFWFLLCSCLIASIGLNTNSVAVIIGAMLVSPLMGPILGLGFGLATGSRHITLLSIKNCLGAMIISLFFSTLYFWLSPLDETTTEILARSAPNLLDFFVAVAAAFAGVVALTSSGTSAIVPGVAIATAIMPPLCATGYGLSQGDLKLAFGAFYLFFVNALAIAAVAFFLFKRMNFHETDEDIRLKRNIPRSALITTVFLLLTPLVWSLRNIWLDTQNQNTINTIVKQLRENFDVVNWQYDKNDESPKLVLYSFKDMPDDDQKKITEKLKDIHPKFTLVVRNASESRETREILAQLKASPLVPLLNNKEVLDRIVGKAIAPLPDPEPSLRSNHEQLERELSAVVGEELHVFIFNRPSSPNEQIALILYDDRPINEIRKISAEKRALQWIKARMGEQHTLHVIWEKKKSTTLPLEDKHDLHPSETTDVSSGSTKVNTPASDAQSSKSTE